MPVEIVESPVYFIELNIYSRNDREPIKVYVKEHIPEYLIDDMEKYIENKILKGSGAYEASRQFLKENKISVCEIYVKE